jgi:predicted dehydrogenase
MRGALIGAGGRARGHAQAMRVAEGLEFVAVADLEPARAAKLASEYGVKSYTDALAMLAQERPDVVCVCTREKPRAQLVIECARRGARGIVAEKPMAANLAEARDMVAVCEQAGVTLVVSHQMRFCDEFLAAREAVRAGEIGRPYFARACSFGQLMEQGPHMVDMLLFVLDDPAVEWVMGAVGDIEEGRTTVHPAPAFTVGYVAFANGARAELECGRRFPRAVDFGPDFEKVTWMQKRVQVVGTHGIVDAIVGHSCRLLKAGQPWKTLAQGPQGWDNATIGLYRELVESLTRGRQHRNNARASLRGFEIIHGIYEAAWRRERVTWPLPEDTRGLERLMA